MASLTVAATRCCYRHMLISKSASNHLCNHLCKQEPEFCSCEDGTTFSLVTVRAAQVGDDDGLDNDKISGLGPELDSF